MSAPDRTPLVRAWEFIAPGIVLFILPLAHTTPLRFTCIGLSAIAAAITWRRHAALVTRPTAVFALVAWWCLVCIVASATSSDRPYSWGEFRNEVLAPVALFVVLFRLSDSPAAWRRFRTVLFASVVVAAVVAVVGFLANGDWLTRGMVGDRNAFSTYVVLIAPFLFACWQDPPFAGRRSYVAGAMALLVIAGALTANRNMWFAIAIEAAVFGLVAWRASAQANRARVARRLALGAVVGALALGAILAFVIYEKAIVSNTSTEEQARFDRDPRFAIWRYAAGRIAERPLTGYGFGRGILRGDFRTHFDDPLKWHGHNMAIDYVMEAGVIGGLTIVALFAVLYRHAWRTARDADPDVARVGTWVLAMLVGATLKVMTDDILVRESALLFWGCLAIAFGLAARVGKGTGRLSPA